MAIESNLKITEITGDGNITTNNVPGKLHYVRLIGTNSADTIVIKDGTTDKLTMKVQPNHAPAIYDPPTPPLFSTDIDCSATAAGSIFATVHYTELN